MFYGLASGAVDTGGIDVDQVLSDIETLNRAAFEGNMKSPPSRFTPTRTWLDKYALLPHGASMGDNYGPIVVARPAGRRGVKGPQGRDPGHADDGVSRAADLRSRLRDVVVPFDQIQQAVLDGKAEPGCSFTKASSPISDEGLQKIVDLGEWWFGRTGGLPLPLGGNIIRRDLGRDMIAKVSKMLHDSIAHALTHREAAVEYAQQFGRGLGIESPEFVLHREKGLRW